MNLEDSTKFVKYEVNYPFHFVLGSLCHVRLLNDGFTKQMFLYNPEICITFVYSDLDTSVKIRKNKSCINYVSIRYIQIPSKPLSTTEPDWQN